MVNEKFKLLEHTADIYIETYGDCLEEAFENAAFAMTEVMTDIDKVERKIVEDVEVQGYDKYSLLYEWLEEILVRFDIKQNLYSKFKIEGIKQKLNKYYLKARIWGEKFKEDKHSQKLGVKAITYHMMEIKERKGKFIAKFILDI